MVRSRHIVLLIFDNGVPILNSFVESFELADGVSLGVVYFYFAIVLVFGLGFVFLFKYFLEAAALAELDSHLARAAIVGPFAGELDGLDGRREELVLLVLLQLDFDLAHARIFIISI